MRLDDDPIVAEITALQTELREIKNRQPVGNDSLVNHLTISSAQNDFTVSLAIGETKTYTITFTHDNSKRGSIQRLYLLYSPNPDVVNNQEPAYFVSPLTLQKLPPTDTVNTWRLAVKNVSGVAKTYYLKLIFNGTDSGTWQIV